MMRSKKIYVNKNDDAVQVIEGVIESQAKEIILSIPKFSKFSELKNNFHLLKREGESSNKKIFIESVDDRVIELANTSGIPASNPFFVKPDRQFQDIIINKNIKRAPIRPNQESTLDNAKTILVNSKIKDRHDTQILDDNFLPPRKIMARSSDASLNDLEMSSKLAEEIEAEFGPEESTDSKFSAKKVFGILGIVLVSGILSFVSIYVLPEAEIKIIAQKADYVYQNAVVVDKTIKVADPVSMKIPGQIFTEKKNLSLAFKASGKKQVSKKSNGKITIYNAYSSEPQKLVSTTRFMTPDGKIFRLTQTIVVPGAKIVDGKIVSSSIESGIIADKAGVEYNIVGNIRFTIPGFKGTPRYEGFYAEAKGDISGGFIGEIAYPTEEDIRLAKIEISKALGDATKVAVLEKIPKEFKMVENSFFFNIVKQTVNSEANEQGQFTIFAEAENTVMAFLEDDIRNSLSARVKNEIGENHIIKTDKLSYGLARVDLAVGRMTFPIDYKAILARKIDNESLKSQFYNKSEKDLKALLLSMPGLESAEINLWPRWVRRVPNRSDKVVVIVD